MSAYEVEWSRGMTAPHRHTMPGTRTTEAGYPSSSINAANSFAIQVGLIGDATLPVPPATVPSSSRPNATPNPTATHPKTKHEPCEPPPPLPPSSTLPSSTAPNTRTSRTIIPTQPTLDLTTKITARQRGISGQDQIQILQIDIVARLDRTTLQTRDRRTLRGAAESAHRDVVNLDLGIGAVGRGAAAAEGGALRDGYGGAAEGGGGERRDGHVGDVWVTC